MNAANMFPQTIMKCVLFAASSTRVLFHTAVICNVVGVRQTIGEAFSAVFAFVPRAIVVYVFDVFPETIV